MIALEFVEVSTIENECGICGGVEVTTDCSCDDMQVL